MTRRSVWTTQSRFNLLRVALNLRSILVMLSLLSTRTIAFRPGSSLALRKVTPILGNLGNQVRSKTIASDNVRSNTRCGMTIADTALGNTSCGKDLLNGLDVYTVPASGDEHPLSVYGIDSESPLQSTHDSNLVRPILLLHGRTWSSIPVYHLLGGPQREEKGEESRSLMETFRENGLQPYAMDFRGFGGTPPDATNCVEPMRCVADVETVLKWIAERHGMVSSKVNGNEESGIEMPALLGWSQGALVAQMAAQKSEPLISKLVLYGSIYDPMVRYPRDPLYTISPVDAETAIQNTRDSAMEDFTIEGTISHDTAMQFAEASMVSDPVKANWQHLYQFNNLDPARVHVPTLVVAGDQDPYAPLHVQQELYANLGRGSDRTWSILADADHAVHLLDGRERFSNIVTSFVQNGKRSDSHYYY